MPDGVGYNPVGARGSVLDLFELQEEFVGLPIGVAAELADIVGKHHDTRPTPGSSSTPARR